MKKIRALWIPIILVLLLQITTAEQQANVLIYSENKPTHPGVYYYFYSNSQKNHLMTIIVDVNPADFQNLPISAFDVYADLGNIVSNTVVHAVSSSEVSGVYRFIITYDLAGKSVNKGPQEIIIGATVTVSGQVVDDGAIGGWSAVRNFNSIF